MRSHIFVAALLFALAIAKMEVDDLNDDSYTLRQGSREVCPQKMTFNTEELTIESGDIKYDEETKCNSGGPLTLKAVASGTNVEGESRAVKYFHSKIEDVEDFLQTKPTADLVCGAYEFSSDDTWIFMKPGEDIDVTWSTVFGNDPDFVTNENSINKDKKYELDEERYLLIGGKCLYEDTSFFNDRVCFPSSATAQLQDGSVKTMDQLSIGDRVHVGNGVYSPIFAWTHRHANVKYSFVKLTTESGHAITATYGHYIRADDTLMTMKSVKVGMTLRTADGHLTKIVGKERVRDTGLYNPQTAHGDIVVDGIVATTYTTAVEPKTAHALLTPVRAAFSLARTLITTGSDEL